MLDVYNESLPVPEFTQAENVGLGNNDQAIKKGLDLSIINTSFENSLNGAEELSTDDFYIPVHGGLNLKFSRTYSSALSSFNPGLIGPGWCSNIDEKIEWLSEGYIRYYSSAGEVYTFTPNRDADGTIISWASPPQLKAKVQIIGEGDNSSAIITSEDKFVSYYFSRHGRLTKITSAFGGEIACIRDINNRMLSLVDTYSGRALSFTYDVDNRIVSVTGPDNNRNWTYEYDLNGNLATATNPIGGTWNYLYNQDHFITRVTNPRSYKKDITYSNGKVSSIQLDGSTYPKTIQYGTTTYSTRMIEPTGENTTSRFSEIGQLIGLSDATHDWVQFQYDFEFSNDPLRMVNQDGDIVASIEYNDDRQASYLFDTLGETTEYTYTTTGKVASIKDREGKITYVNWNTEGTMPVKITDALGREVLYQYDTNKNLIKIISPYKSGDNAETQFEYDSKGYVNKIINPLGKTTTMVYNDYGEMISTTNAINKTSEITYNKMGWITKVKSPSPDYYEINYTYDANGNVTKIKNSRNYETNFEYDARDLKTKAINALNQNTYYEYDDSGKLVKVKDHKNNQSTLTYDNCGRLLKITDQDGKFTQTIYNKLGNIAGYTDNTNHTTEIIYDKLYRPTEVKSPEGSIVKYEYDKEGHVKKVIDPLNRQVTYDYDNCYQVTKVTNNAGKYSTIEYWPSGQVKKTTDPLGHIAEYDYNKLGLPTSVKDNAGNETTTLYDDLGRCTKVTNPLNQHVDFEYDMYGNVTKSYNELGKYTTYEYDANGNCTKMTTPLGRIYQWTYDELDRVKKTISPLGFEYVKTYDDVGNLVQVQDPLQKLEKYEYTDTYNVKKYIDQINNETAFDYDSANQLSKVTLPKGTYQQYTYDKDNQLKTVTDPLGNIAQYLYNLGGELTERKLPNPSGGTTSFTYTYDSLGRRTGFTDEASQTTTCTYNDVNQVTRIDHPNGKYITSTFDNLSRITGVNFGGGQSFSFAYDQLSRTTSATDQHGTKSISYDAASRVTSVTDPFGDQTTISYDDDDRVTSVTTPLGATSTIYDNDSRPTQITLATGGQIGNTFDNINRLTHSDIPNGVDVDFSYNDASWVTQKTYSTPDPLTNNRNENDPDSLFIQTGKMASWMAGQLPKNPTYADLMKLNLSKMPRSSPYAPTRTFPTIASFSYTYDSNQNITQRAYPGGTQSFTYDNYDRLTQAIMPDGTYTYTYDSRSNRTTQRFVNTAQTVDQTTSYTYSIDDRLTSYSVLNNLNQQIIRTASFTYDNAGNTTQKQITEGGNTYTTSYTYYDDNRIHTATLPNNDVITYTYHADGTRATKTTPTEYIEYHYAGSLIKEVHMNPSNHSQIYFTLHFQPSRMIYDPLAPGGGDEIKYYTVADTQGTIYKLLDYQGSTVAEYTYDPFGNILTNSAPTIYNPVGFAGTYYEQDTGLLFAQARYFDPTISRFTTKDSYRGDATSTISQNRYVYCAQNPTSFVDPSGFAPAREEDGTKNVLIKNGKFTDDDASGSIGSVASSSHTSAPRGNAIKTAPDDVITNTNSAGKDLEPPEDKPNEVTDKDKEWAEKNTGNGEKYTDPKTGDTCYLCRVNGVAVKITHHTDGSTDVEAIFLSGVRYSERERTEFEQTAKGLEAALNVSGAWEQFIGSGSDTWRISVSRISTFMTENEATFKAMYGSYNVFEHNPELYFNLAYGATIGYCVARYLTDTKYNPDADLLKSKLSSFLGNLSSSQGIPQMSPFDYIMMQGFWAAVHNKGDIPLSSKVVNLESKMGYVQLTAVQMTMHIVLSCGGQRHLENYTSTEASTINSILSWTLGLASLVLSIGTGGGYIASTTFLTVTGLWTSFCSMMLTVDPVATPSPANQIITHTGITVEMLQTLGSYDLYTNIFHQYDINSMFCSTGLAADYLSKCISHVCTTEGGNGISAGKVTYGLIEFMGHSLNGYIGVESGRDLAISIMTELNSTVKDTDFTEWKKKFGARFRGLNEGI